MIKNQVVKRITEKTTTARIDLVVVQVNQADEEMIALEAKEITDLVTGGMIVLKDFERRIDAHTH